MSRRALPVLAAAAIAVAAIANAWSSPGAPRVARSSRPSRPRPAAVLPPPQYGPTLPPGATHGLAQRLRQYPAIALATAVQRAAAARLLTQLRATAAKWADPRAARAAGF